MWSHSVMASRRLPAPIHQRSEHYVDSVFSSPPPHCIHHRGLFTLPLQCSQISRLPHLQDHCSLFRLSPSPTITGLLTKNLPNDTSSTVPPKSSSQMNLTTLLSCLDISMPLHYGKKKSLVSIHNLKGPTEYNDSLCFHLHPSALPCFTFDVFL